MRLADIIKPENIILSLQGNNIEEVIDKMLSVAKDVNKGNVSEIKNELLLREDQIGTMLGNGIFFPHARVGEKGLVNVALGINRDGINLETPDGKPIKFCFIVIAPFEKNSLLLNCRAAFLKLILTPDLSSRLFEAQTPEEVYSIIKESNINVIETLIAADVMRRDVLSIRPDLSLRKVLELMFENEIDTLPVSDEDGKLLGVVSGQEIIRMAIPKFIDGLTSLSFVKSRTPFDQILSRRDTVKAEEIMEKDFLKAHSDTSLLQIAHMMASSSEQFVFIVDPYNDGKFVGLINIRELLTTILVA
ncbi:CBS domain-containing protein [bacterium]|nr:CBS domain-containing protein [bacterium]